MKSDILQQIQYYRERAPEYDEWFFRQGRYDRGDTHRQQWESEVFKVESALRASYPSGDILELACGTGLWTQHLAPFANRLTAVDASPEMIKLNQQRVDSASVEYIVANLFDWTPHRQFDQRSEQAPSSYGGVISDFIFFGFWLSHVPAQQFESFWQIVERALKPNGRVFFVDSLFTQESTAQNHAALHRRGYSERKLNNGRIYRVVKIFYDPTQLKQSLQRLGWLGHIYQTENYFLHGLFYKISHNNPSAAD